MAAERFRNNSPRTAMSNQRLVEGHVRAVVELGGGQGNFAGDMMDGVFRATGYTRKELELVLTKRLTALEVESFEVSNVWTMQGGTAQRRSRGPPLSLGT